MENRPRGSFTLEREQKAFWNDKGLACMAFLIPLVILALAYGALQVFPFGKRHMLTVDLFHQYAPFLSLLRQKILSGSSLFYSGAIGLGTNFYALLSYYLASPLNLLLLIFPAAYLTEAIFSLTLIKIGLSGLAFYFYLRVSFRRRGALVLAFSSFYALSGFVLAYSWNIMWLDVLILLPVVLLALVRLIRDGKWLLYPLALTLLMVSNYYLAFFACIFIALYAPILLLRYTRDRQPVRRLLVLSKVLGLTILALALAAVVLYPTWQALSITSAAGDKFPQNLELGGRPLAYLGQLLPFLQPTVRSGLPNLYCGLPVLILLPLYFLSSRIRLRERLLNGFLLLFLFLSFDLNVLNFIWHGLHYPNQLPHRFSFVAILLLLTMAYDGLRSSREFRSTEIGLLGLCLTVLIPVVAAVEGDLKLAPWTQWAAMALMMLYALLFSSFKSRKYKRRVHVNILLALMLFEIVLSSFSGLYFMDQNEYYGNREGYSAGATVDSIRQAVDQIEKMNPQGDFYRLETRPHKTSNDPALYGYRGLSLFASTSPRAPVDFFRNLGFYNNGINSYQYRGATLFTEAFLGIKYVIAREETPALETERQIILGNDLVRVYENPYVFPLAFRVDKKTLDFQSVSGNAFKNQNQLVTAMVGGDSQLFEHLFYDQIQGDSLNKPGQGAATFNFSDLTDAQSRRFTVTWRSETSAPHYLYLDMRGHDLDSLTLTADGQDIPVDGKRKGIVELGLIPQGGILSLSVDLAEGAPASGSFEARVASMDMDLLAALSAQAQAASLTDLVYQDGLVTGRLEADKEGYLLISMPFDPGWKAYINGQEVEIRSLDQALMAIPVKEGHQELFLTFLPQGFNEGLLVSSAALGLLILILLGRAVFILFQRKKAGQPLSFALAFQSIKQRTFLSKRKTKRGDMDLIEGDEEGKDPL